MDAIYTSLKDLFESGRKFKTLYIDPPWAYSNQSTRSATDKHYTTMSISMLKTLPIENIAEDQAHLHLWATNAFLFEAKSLMAAWGFEYKSVLLWVKPQMGIGNYWRVCHEFLLLGTRGQLQMKDARKTLMSWHVVPRSEHSVKPNYFRKLVEQVSYQPRVEIFARAAYDGWTVCGNEILGIDLYGNV